MDTIKVSLVIGILSGAAILAFSFHRDADYTFKDSSENDGTIIFTFVSDMSPALPDDPKEPGAFDEILIHVGLVDDVKGVAVGRMGPDVWRWIFDDRSEIWIATKMCADRVTCVESVKVLPDLKTRALHLNAERHRREQIRERLDARRKSTDKVTTKGGYPACRSEQWLSDVVATYSSGDKETRAVYYLTGKCTILGAGYTVTMVDWPGIFGGRASFLYKGQKLWIPREGLDY